DHGDSPGVTAAPTTGGKVRVSKESQFLLQIRTTLAQQESLAQQVRVNGRIVAQPQRQARLVSPVTGILPGALPTLGQRVRQGQILGVVEQTLSASEQLQAKTDLSRAAAELRQVEANLAATASEVSVARQTWERLQRLSQVVAGKDIPQAEQVYRAAL